MKVELRICYQVHGYNDTWNDFGKKKLHNEKEIQHNIAGAIYERKENVIVI